QLRRAAVPLTRWGFVRRCSVQRLHHVHRRDAVAGQVADLRLVELGVGGVTEPGPEGLGVLYRDKGRVAQSMCLGLFELLAYQCRTDAAATCAWCDGQVVQVKAVGL